MRLIRNRKAVALRAHSVRFGALSILSGAVGFAADNWSSFQDLVPLTPVWFWGIGLFFSMVAVGGRFINQDL